MKNLTRMVLVAVAAIALMAAGCGDDGGPDANSAAAGICSALAGPQCNLIAGGVQACTQQVQLCVQNNLTENQKSDWARAINQCLTFRDCGVISNCYNNVPTC